MVLSTQPYKGARDFYPEDKRLQKYMFGKLREVVERYGYEEYDAPILEPVELYLAKTGEEIVNEQTYVFDDRGGRRVVIRPEMTPTVSRMVAAKRQELAYPLRWYSIPNLWRYERPQRGRLREHWQLNVDLFGVEYTTAELEMITLVSDIFKAFGAQPDMYAIKVNSRELIDFILRSYLQLDEAQAHRLGKLIDRMHKMELPEFISQVDEILSAGQRQQGLTQKLLEILNAPGLAALPAELQGLPAVTALRELLNQLQAAGVANAAYDPSLMRGFDYYTGIVFEVFDSHPDNNRAMMGGGRYDGLVGLFGVPPVPTVGFGWGDVTLANFLEIHHLLPPLKAETEVYVVLARVSAAQATPAVAQLRAAGLNVAVDLSSRKLGAQLTTADKKGVRWAMVVGENELAQQQFNLKNLATGEEQRLGIEAIAKTIHDSH